MKLYEEEDTYALRARLIAEMAETLRPTMRPADEYTHDTGVELDPQQAKAYDALMAVISNSYRRAEAAARRDRTTAAHCESLQISAMMEVVDYIVFEKKRREGPSPFEPL